MGVETFKSKYLSPTAESKPHGLALQEDIWDADVDLHQKLLRRWKELKERSGHKYACQGLDFSESILQTLIFYRISFFPTSQDVVFSSKRIEAVFEVNTDLQKHVQAKVTAQLTWPSVVNSSQRIMFPLTNTNSSSVSGNNPPLLIPLLEAHVGVT